MAVQFFFANPQERYGESATKGYELGQKMRKGEIERDLARTYNKHVVTKPQYNSAGEVIARPGDLNASGFIKSAKERGLPMKESMQYLDHQKALRDAMLDQAQTDSNARDLGYDPSPSVTGRAGAPIGNPPTIEDTYLKVADKADKSSLEDWFAGIKSPPPAQAPVAPAAEETAANDKPVAGLRDPNEGSQSATGITHEDVAKVLGIGGAQAPQVSADGTQMDLGYGVIQDSRPEKPVEEAKLQAPEDWTGIYVPPANSARVPDTRTAGQAVQDTYSPQVASMGTGIADAEANGVFDWEPVDDGSNEFRKYKSTLDSHLKSAGMVDAEGNPDPSKLLKELYTNVYNQNLSAKPDPKLRALGPEGRKAYIVAEAEYKASQIKAAGLAGKAVLEQRQKLSEEANKYGVQTNDSTEEKRKKEKHEADMGGRRAGSVAGSKIIRLYAVSEAEKTRGENIANAYLDLEESKELGGFEGDYAGAMAKAKADGNVNADVITGHLIAMGSFPSEKSTYIKQMLSTTPSSAWDVVLKKIYAEIGNRFYRDDAKRAKWYAGAEQNMKDAMRLVGYGVLDTKKKERTAKDDLEDALGKKPEAKKPTKSTAKLGSITNPYPAGATPPVGSYYVHPRTGNVMKRTK